MFRQKWQWTLPGLVLLLSSVGAMANGPSGAAKADASKIDAAKSDPNKPGKSGDSVRVAPEQLRQIKTTPAAQMEFPLVKVGIGQIAFDEDKSSVLVTPFSGRVTKLHAKVGDVVARGAPMFELESPEIVQAQTELLAAVQAVSKSRALVAFAKRTLDRQTSLIAGQATSQRDLDLARNDMAAAEADFKTAEGALMSARNRLIVMVGRTPEEVELIETERRINPKVTVTAPISGTVVARKIGPGQYVRSDINDSLFAIADLSAMWFKAAVPENDIPHVKVGQEVEVRVAALSNRSYKTKVAAIGMASDSVTHRVTVRADLPNADGALRGEMFATFKIHTERGDPGPGVPVEAIVWDGEYPTLWVETEPRVFKRRKVMIGREYEGHVQIVEGLRAGEVVATRGAIFIDNEWRQ